jgi:hypothetical protein
MATRQVGERVDIMLDGKHDIAAAAAIAAVRSAARNILLPAKGNRAVAAAAERSRELAAVQES